MKKLLRHEAQRIDLEGRFVEVTDLEGGEAKRLDYDHLIIATGSRPVMWMSRGQASYGARCPRRFEP